MKKRSKYVGMTFGRRYHWKVVAIYLAANYSGTTRHNSYRYELSRRTSDHKCDKIITISGNTMTKIAKGLISPETVANNKMKRAKIKTINNILYRY